MQNAERVLWPWAESSVSVLHAVQCCRYATKGREAEIHYNILGLTGDIYSISSPARPRNYFVRRLDSQLGTGSPKN